MGQTRKFTGWVWEIQHELKPKEGIDEDEATAVRGEGVEKGEDEEGLARL